MSELIEKQIGDKQDECFKIYVNTIGEDVVVLKFDTEEEMEKTWMWLRNTIPR